jgi:hypothetical protein
MPAADARAAADSDTWGASADTSGGNAIATAVLDPGASPMIFASRAELLRHLRRGGQLATTAPRADQHSAAPNDNAARISPPSSTGDGDPLHDTAGAVPCSVGHAASATVRSTGDHTHGGSSDAEPNGICPVPLCLPAGSDLLQRASPTFGSASTLCRWRIRGKQRVPARPPSPRCNVLDASSSSQGPAMAVGGTAVPLHPRLRGSELPAA